LKASTAALLIPMKAPRVLLIEDDHAIAASLGPVLREEGYEVVHEPRGDDGFRQATEGQFDAVLADLKLPGLNGLDLVRALHQARPRLPIILITAHGTTDTAIDAMKSGAYDYLLKPFHVPELLDLLARAVRSSRQMSETVELGPSVPGRAAIVGQSRAMQMVYKEIGRVAARPVTVLILGETGTGKELVARAIYQHSERAGKPFVAVHCAAIPETLLESELFGHERGAFTGADSRRIGRFEQAHEGVILLDEVGDMTLGTQIKLLRVLQEKTIQRLGSRETIPVDVRVIAATHRDLEGAIRAGDFREDLYYRLNVATIVLPPLRDRPEDVPALVGYFMQKFGPELGHAAPVVQADALEVFRGHRWPGNVRELENVVRKSLLRTQGYPITAEHVRTALRGVGAIGPKAEPSVRQAVAELLAAAQCGELTDVRERLLNEADRELFSQAIRLARGNQAKAARWLGVARLTMREKLNQFGIPVDSPDES
jgi:DNA-binding NtrC family response regulator